MCLSTPRVVTFRSRAGSVTRALASTSVAFQAVCQPTPQLAGKRGTVVSSLPAQLASSPAVQHRAASPINAETFTERASGQSASPERQIRTQPTVTNRKHTAQVAAVLDLAGLHGQHQPLSLIELNIEDVHVGNVEDRLSRAHQRAPEPHLE
jgi:hypothetical protein